MAANTETKPTPTPYVGETNPWSIRYALANRGLRFDLPEDFLCCHIGGKPGPALAAHTAANPAARFIAAGGDLPDSDLSDSDFPECDLIVVHGAVLRGGAIPTASLEAIGRKLKPGGALYVDYDTLPGAAALYSLMQLSHIYAGAAGDERPAAGAGEPFVSLSGEKPTDPAAHGAAMLDFADRLLAVESPYTRVHKGLEARLDRLRDGDDEHVVERAAGADWAPAWFHQVAATLQREGVLYGGPARLVDQVDQLAFPQHLKRAVGAIADPIVEESIKDLLANRAYRQDIFVRHPRPMPRAEKAAYLLDIPFVLLKPAESFSYRLKGPFGGGTLREEQYGPLLEALADDDYRPKPASELMATPAFAKVRRPQILRMLAILTGVGFAHPARPAGQVAAADRACARHNVESCRRALAGDQPAYLVAPQTGGVVPVPQVQGLFLLAGAGRQGDPEEWAKFAVIAAAAAGRRVARPGNPVKSGGDALAAMVAGAERFAASALPVLCALGIAPLVDESPASDGQPRIAEGA